MPGLLYTDDQLRAMYTGGRGNATARRFARLWAAVQGAGLLPRRWVTLEVPGRRTGRTTRFPLGLADWDGRWYLVSMLGNDCNWVRNVRAAGGRVTIRHGRARARQLVELPAAERAPILKRYLQQVPGARPHVPVDRDAPLAEFEAIAARYPVFRIEPTTPPGATPVRRRRRWLRWTLAGLATLALLLVATVVAAVKLTPVPSPLSLPASTTSPAGPLDGAYGPVAGSLAGFRIRQTVVGLTSEVVGRTADVTGTVTVAADRVTAAHLRIGLRALTAGGDKPAPQFDISLDTGRYPDATVELTQPIALEPGAAGATVTVTGMLTLHGVTRTVTVDLSVRRDGDGLDAAGSLPVAFADYSLTGPEGYGAFGSLADHGTAEFLLLLRRS
ncbi:nitroreductase/quinone reductase family protein [Dactylosporangium sp. NPDC049140]|uniref:nitroreductase/quinone reductase family protein n=1 Tax=Dactylosporangium sp. NPDC049140 TaxID=3155647 RepID=UPI0033DCF17E